MNKVTGKLTVIFEEPFWVGVFERTENGKLSVAKIVFGAEPKEYDVLALILKQYDKLQFSPTVNAVTKETRKNPKRKLREAKKQLLDRGIGTKSQQALKLQQEECKKLRKSRIRKQQEEESEHKFALKQQKKKEKHKGR